ncbi:hypothetical protein CUMW_040400 [Citrus unshiu]|nr:hypothetical protein CUMW_040400 [Citrus unshiu]
MGNCQAIDAATLAIQHPCGKVDKFYWPVSACEVMRMNPDVMKGLSAKKQAKMNRNRPQSAEKPERVNEKPKRSELEKDNQVMKQERHRPRTTVSTNSAAARSRNWQPSLQSISEAGS